MVRRPFKVGQLCMWSQECDGSKGIKEAELSDCGWETRGSTCKVEGAATSRSTHHANPQVQFDQGVI